MKNEHASDGIAEDMIRSIVQLGCGEAHLKTLYEKTQAELENGIIDDTEMIGKQVEKLETIQEQINETAQVRREVMLKLFEMYDGDKTAWCLVKHLGIATYTLFEAYQASDDDPELLNLSYEANKSFIKALSQFLGIEPVSCASCFADMLKKKGD